MLTYEPKGRGPMDIQGASSGSAMSQYLADAACEIKSRQRATGNPINVEADRERVALQRRRDAEDRAIRRRVRSEWRATLTRKERVAENVRQLKRLRLVWLVVSVSLAGVAIVAAALAGASATLGLVGTVYIVALVLSAKIIHRRARRLPADHVERVHEQLDRVKSTFHTA